MLFRRGLAATAFSSSPVNPQRMLSKSSSETTDVAAEMSPLSNKKWEQNRCTLPMNGASSVCESIGNARSCMLRAARLVNVRHSISLKGTPASHAFLSRSAKICVFPQPGGANTRWNPSVRFSTNSCEASGIKALLMGTKIV